MEMIHKIGRRKTAVDRVYVTEGNGNITITGTGGIGNSANFGNEITGDAVVSTESVLFIIPPETTSTSPPDNLVQGPVHPSAAAPCPSTVASVV